MPKKSERERLADLEARQRKVAEEVEIARRALRGRYASIIGELAVEELTEREFRELVDLAIRCGGAAAVGALKSLPIRPPK
jgi:cell division inhibitor SulA